MPMIVVRMKPEGLLGPGEIRRARMPAMKPTMITQMMPPMFVLPKQQRRDYAASQPAGEFIVGRQPALRCQMIDHLRQILAEALQQLVARHAALRRDLIELVSAERL